MTDKPHRKVNIMGIEVEVHSNQEIVDSQAPHVCPRLAGREPPFERYGFVPGSIAGCFCSLCSQEVIMAPSGQAIQAHGKNPIVCLDCMLSIIEKKEAS